MLNFIKSWFGQGKVRTEFVCSDGSCGVAKIAYVGDISTLTASELIDHIKKTILVEYGKQVVNVKVIGVC